MIDFAALADTTPSGPVPHGFRALLEPVPPTVAPARGARATPGPMVEPIAAALSAAALCAVLDEIDYGVMVVEAPGGRVRHVNRQAGDECRRHGTIDLRDGVASVGEPTQQRAFVTALVHAAQGRRSLINLRGRATAADDAELPPVPVAVVPLPNDGATGQALLVFGKRHVADALSVGFFSRLHALTPTEDAVLLSLCRGMKPTEIADEHGVAISTVRTHVNSIRLKTGTGSIRDLVHKVSTLPPMASALRAGTH
jgi:DNA-binding CsgD family transcriptional regulator